MPSKNYENLTFKFGMNHLPSIKQYTYLGISFNETMSLIQCQSLQDEQ